MATYEDVDIFDVMKHMDIRDAIKLSLTDRRAYLISQTDMFWRFFLKRDYPLFVIDKDENLQSAYRKIYSNKDVKKIDMKSGETFEQFRYHQNLNSFYCDNDQLTSLVGCPPCRILGCSNNRLASLVGCPSNVRILHCANNRLTSLVGCPESIKILDCSNNGLTSLVGCPASVENLYCHDNQLTSLFGCSTCKILHCDNNQLTSLIGCPASVENLNCSNNRLTSLVGCPESVKILDCGSNILTSLDGCPVSVEKLWCNHDFLQTLHIYLPRIWNITYHNNPLIPPWNEYSKEQIMDIMRDPAYHE